MLVVCKLALLWLMCLMFYGIFVLLYGFVLLGLIVLRRFCGLLVVFCFVLDLFCFVISDSFALFCWFVFEWFDALTSVICLIVQFFDLFAFVSLLLDYFVLDFEFGLWFLIALVLLLFFIGTCCWFNVLLRFCVGRPCLPLVGWGLWFVLLFDFLCVALVGLLVLIMYFDYVCWACCSWYFRRIIFVGLSWKWVLWFDCFVSGFVLRGLFLNEFFGLFWVFCLFTRLLIFCVCFNLLVYLIWLLFVDVWFGF